MEDYSLIQRAEFYARAFPNWPPLYADRRWIHGMWIMGQYYKTANYYGAYPNGYLERVHAIFPDAEHILHLFSGSLPQSKEYTTFDISTNLAEISGDAHALSKYFDPSSYDLILADPPYSIEDAEHYGTCMINRNQVLKECANILMPGGFVVWLDQVLPMYSKEYLHHVGAIGMVRSTNHRFRVVSIFQKPGASLYV